jgi:hypothetical protein
LLHWCSSIVSEEKVHIGSMPTILVLHSENLVSPVSLIARGALW